MSEGKQIDWSKAPNDATHFTPKRDDSGCWCDVFWRFEDGKAVEAWRIERDCSLTHIAYPSITDDLYERAVKRPIVWGGIGLPPVGTSCVLIGKDAGTVVAHVDAPIGRQAVIQLLGDWAWGLAGDFAPIRTPEQIAADERLHKIRNACTAISGTLDELRGRTKVERAAVRVIEAMIDAGYVKGEA